MADYQNAVLQAIDNLHEDVRDLKRAVNDTNKSYEIRFKELEGRVTQTEGRLKTLKTLGSAAAAIVSGLMFVVTEWDKIHLAIQIFFQK